MAPFCFRVSSLLASKNRLVDSTRLDSSPRGRLPQLALLLFRHGAGQLDLPELLLVPTRAACRAARKAPELEVGCVGCFFGHDSRQQKTTKNTHTHTLCLHGSFQKTKASRHDLLVREMQGMRIGMTPRCVLFFLNMQLVVSLEGIPFWFMPSFQQNEGFAYILAPKVLTTMLTPTKQVIGWHTNRYTAHAFVDFHKWMGHKWDCLSVKPTVTHLSACLIPLQQVSNMG